MKKVLMKCETYMMLIVAIQIRRHFINTEDKVDLVLTDETRNSQKIAERLRETGIFDSIYYIKTKEKYKGGNLKKKIRKIFYVYETKKKAEKFMGISNWMYDDFFFCNYDIAAHQIFRYIWKVNKNIDCHRFEEGYSTYTVRNDYRILSLFMKITNNLLREKNLEKEVRDAYFYEPELVMYKTGFPVKKIPPVNKSDRELIEKLNFIFGYKEEALEYQYPYIIFEECFSVDKKEHIDDCSLFENIINLVGKDNVIIKLHPRNNKNRFERSGVKTGNSNMPWEIIMLNGDFLNTTFITISSGSVLNSFVMSEGKINALLLYQCTEVRPRFCDKKYDNYVESLIRKSKSNRLLIPDNILQLNKYLREKSNEKNSI